VSWSTNAGSASAEIRQAVALLRDDAQDVAPQPGLADLEGLLTRFRDAGLEVNALLPDADVGPVVGLTVYRVVQEALTNTLRHAGRTRAHVRIGAGPREVRVVVADEGPVPDTGDAAVEDRHTGGGYGLVGLRERVRAHGGVMTVRTGDAGYVVDARIPTTAPDVPANVPSRRASAVAGDPATTT